MWRGGGGLTLSRDTLWLGLDPRLVWTGPENMLQRWTCVKSTLIQRLMYAGFCSDYSRRVLSMTYLDTRWPDAMSSQEAGRGGGGVDSATVETQKIYGLFWDGSWQSSRVTHAKTVARVNWKSVCSMLSQRLRRWPSIDQTLWRIVQLAR